MFSKCPGKKDIFKKLRVRFVQFSKDNFFKIIFVSNNFVSEGTKKLRKMKPKDQTKSTTILWLFFVVILHPCKPIPP